MFKTYFCITFGEENCDIFFSEGAFMPENALTVTYIRLLINTSDMPQMFTRQGYIAWAY